MSYRRSISFAAHFNARIVFFASVITGVKRCGILLYKVSSTRFGSTIMNLRLSGELRYKSDVIMAWILTDFPEPVAPAIRRCGAFARFPKYDVPEMPLPRHISRGLSEF